MTNNPSFASFKRSYRPWGQVRRRNMVSRVLHIISMTALGLALLAGLAFLVVFAASLAVVGSVAVALMALAAFVTRKPVRIFVRGGEKTKDDGKGLYEARKTGSTWSVY
jgi:hypothetical protein